MGLTGAGIVGMASAASDGEAPDLIVFNAKVYTVDSRMPKAEAFAVKASRFTAIGSSAEIKSLAGKGTQTLDAKQMTIVPGFIDCHNHAPGDTLLYEVLVGNPYVAEFVTIDSIIAKAPCQGPADAGGHLGGRVFLRRHQGEGQSHAQCSRSGSGVERPSGCGPSSRRAHCFLQQQGAGDGGREQEHAQSAGRNFRSRPKRRT